MYMPGRRRTALRPSFEAFEDLDVRTGVLGRRREVVGSEVVGSEVVGLEVVGFEAVGLEVGVGVGVLVVFGFVEGFVR
jgi:hypothetical protein